VTITASLSPVVKYHGLARRSLLPLRFLMRPLLDGGTLGRPVHTQPDVRFGSFEKLVGTAVHRDPWWFRTAQGVVLDGTVLWTDLGECVQLGPCESGEHSQLDTAWFESVAEVPDARWFRRHAPIALSLASGPTSFAVDLIATRARGGASAAYPFLLRETDGRIMCGFSDGLEVDVRISILSALAGRFLWAAKPT